MTSATEKLRQMLTERGAEWDKGEFPNEARTCWRDVVAKPWDEQRLYVTALLTPEQAVAATLGQGTLTVEQVRKAIERNFTKVAVIDDGGEKVEWREGWVCNVGLNMQAIADELNAALGNQEENADD